MDVQTLFSSIINNLNELYSNFSGLMDLIVFVSSIAGIIYGVATARKKFNKDSKFNIQRLEDNGKYIRSLYAEVDNSHEELRYFLYQEKWKHRIVESFSLLFAGSIGFLINKHLPNVFSINKSLCFHCLKIELKKKKEKLKNTQNIAELKDKGDLIYLVRLYGTSTAHKISELISLCEMATTRAAIVVGAAGSGKTNLLCSFAETIIKTENLCIFFESRQVKRDCVEFFYEKIHCPNPKLKNIYLHLVTSVLWVMRKNIYIVVDAINENDQESFITSLQYLNSLVAKNSRIKILYSCREEFFKERFHNAFGDAANCILVKHIRRDSPGNRATNYTFLKYKRHFNFTGNITENVKAKLFSSMILLRIFFEININSNHDVFELHSAELYNEYIKKVAKNKAAGFELLLNKITNYMIHTKTFNEINIADLLFNEAEQSNLCELIDNNLVVSRKAIKDERSIIEHAAEAIYFPFDELRDYCIARYSLLECNRQADFSNFF